MASIKKRCGNYLVRACVGRDEFTGEQVWRSCTIQTPPNLTPARELKEIKRLANEWEKEQRELYIESGRPKKDPTKLSLADFADNHYMADNIMDGQHAPSTISWYSNMIIAIKKYFKEKSLSSINAEECKRFAKYLSTSAKSQRGRPYSKSSAMHIFKCFNAILEYAVRMGYIRNNPVDRLKASERPHGEHKEIDFLTPEQAKNFRKALEREPLFWRAYMNLLMQSGLRRGEAVGLQWRDLDVKGRKLTVERNVTDTPEGAHIGQTKGKRARVVPVSDEVLSLLLRLQDEQKEKYGPMLGTAFIFCSDCDPSRPIYPTSPTRWMQRFVAKYNLPSVSPHDLRHTSAALMLESGSNIKEVQEILGHMDAGTTLQYYAGITEESKHRSVDAVAALLKGSN